MAGVATQAALGGTQYLNGQIPVTAITPFAKAVLALLPATTNNKSSNNYVILHPISNDRDKGDAKIDYDPRQNLRLFARYSQSRVNVFDPGTIPGTAGGDGDGHVLVPVIQIVGGATWTINPVSVFEARFGFSRDEAGKTPALSGGPSMLDMFGITGLPTETGQIPWDGPHVRVIEHQAHAPGHASLLIGDRGVLVAGDMLSDVLIPMLNLMGTADPIEDYLAALRLLQSAAGDVDVLVPGHGSIGGADQVRARIEQDRAYVLALREAGGSGDPRLGPSAYGKDFLPAVYARQLQGLARRSERNAT